MFRSLEVDKTISLAPGAPPRPAPVPPVGCPDFGFGKQIVYIYIYIYIYIINNIPGHALHEKALRR